MKRGRKTGSKMTSTLLFGKAICPIKLMLPINTRTREKHRPVEIHRFDPRR
jgi:hypothetical protein